jgi:hypothetical protein
MFDHTSSAVRRVNLAAWLFSNNCWVASAGQRAASCRSGRRARYVHRAEIRAQAASLAGVFSSQAVMINFSIDILFLFAKKSSWDAPHDAATSSFGNGPSRIASGELPLGDRVNARHIATELNVSRTTANKAIEQRTLWNR